MNLDEHVKTDGEKPCSSNICFRQSITLVSARLAAPSRDMVPAENLHLISKLSCHFLLGAVLKLLISAYNCNNFIIISWTVWVHLIKLNTYSPWAESCISSPNWRIISYLVPFYSLWSHLRTVTIPAFKPQLFGFQKWKLYHRRSAVNSFNRRLKWLERLKLT